MSLKTQITGAALALAVSAGAQAGVQTWDFDSPPNFNFAGNGNSWSLSQGGVGLTVTGWSDTGNNNDQQIQNAELIWAQNDALGIVNREEGTGSPDHSVDSNGSSDDFDMLLLTFDRPVELDGIDLKWAYDGGQSHADISILAYDGTGGAGINGSTWAGILNGNGGNYDSVGNHSNVGLNYYAVNNGNVQSTHWLVGVYNSTFGLGSGLAASHDGNDGFKLDKIKTNFDDDPPTGDVPAPGSLALVLLGLAGLRKRRVKS